MKFYYYYLICFSLILSSCSFINRVKGIEIIKGISQGNHKIISNNETYYISYLNDEYVKKVSTEKLIIGLVFQTTKGINETKPSCKMITPIWIIEL